MGVYFYTENERHAGHRYGPSAVQKTMNHQLDVAPPWGVDSVHVICPWIVSPRTSPQWIHLPFAEQPRKTLWGRTKCQLVIPRRACNVTLLSCSSLPWHHSHICLRWTPVKAQRCTNLRRRFAVYGHLPAGASWCAAVLLFLSPIYRCARH